MPLLDRLRARELVVVTGKGGVGKSAVAAALGTALAAAGRRSLILEIDPRENVHQMLAAPPSGGEILAVGPNLHLQHLQPRRVLDQVVRERVRFDAIARRVLASPVYAHFSEGAPGLKEMAVLGHALVLIQGKVPGAPPLDVVVLDAPATGHGVSLLAAPLLVSEVITQGPIAAMTAEVAELVAEPERCGIVVVTTAEEMPVTEALELREMLSYRLGREPDLLVVNALYPEVGVEAAPDEHPLLTLWRQRRRLNRAELGRLERSWTGPRVEIPLQPLDRGPRLTRALAACLESA